MDRIHLNHWFVNENELAISLMSFYVSIKMISENNDIYYIARVVNSNTDIKEISFKFLSLEEAITFTESIIAKCFTFDEIRDKYIVFRDNKEKTYKKERKLWK